MRDTLLRIHEALTGMEGALRAGFAGLAGQHGIGDFLGAVERDVLAARGAIGVVLSRVSIASLLVDNLNASVHLRALLTDLFLIEQTLKAPVAPGNP